MESPLFSLYKYDALGHAVSCRVIFLTSPQNRKRWCKIVRIFLTIIKLSCLRLLNQWITNLQAASSIYRQQNKNVVPSFRIQVDIQNVRTYRLASAKSMPLLLSSNRPHFSFGLYPQQKLASSYHWLRLTNANRPKAATTAAPAAMALYADAHASELAYFQLNELESVP